MVTFFVGVGTPAAGGYNFYTFTWKLEIFRFGEAEWPYAAYFTSMQVTGGNLIIGSLMEQYALFYEGLKHDRKGGQ